MARRKITHGRKAAEKLARRWFAAAGVPPHVVGFSENAGFYLIVHCMKDDKVREYCVPCWGLRPLRREIDAAIKDWTPHEISHP